MTTRYSLPAEARGADTNTARGARTVAVFVLVVGLFTLALGTAILPQAEGVVAVAPEGEAVSTLPGA
jgi:hypothetical protein